MIQIHRSKPVAKIGTSLVQLTTDEHLLLTALGMLDNKLASHQLLLDSLCEGRHQIPDDRKVLWTKIARLRKKIGKDRIRLLKQRGYMLAGDVRFIGSGR